MSRFNLIRNLASKRILVLIAILLLYGSVLMYNTHKPLPKGVSYAGSIHHIPESGLELLNDLTYPDAAGRVSDQVLFARMLQAIREAERFIVLDMFLYNGFYDKGQSFPALSRSLTEALIARKKERPDLTIVVITDDVNTSYGSHPNPELELLKQAGIPVSITDVDPLRDSNPLYTAAWRLTARWFGQEGRGWLPNKMASEAPNMTVRSYLKLLNAKANHRKVLITETTLIVTSANAHDASFHNSNSGYAVSGSPGLIRDALRTEQAALAMSGQGSTIKLPVHWPAPLEEGGESGAGADAAEAQVGVQVLTEGKIREFILRDLGAAGAGDRIWLGMFYLADRSVMRELLAASGRGARVRLILDPNEAAFGNSKIGVPNRPVAAELLKKSEGKISVRWYNTGEEQYHAKIMLIAGGNGAVIHNGSANFTVRNLDDLNLETNLRIEAPAGSRTELEAESYFERLWSNDGAQYTLDYTAYEEKTEPLKRILYQLQDWLGLTTF